MPRLTRAEPTAEVVLDDRVLDDRVLDDSVTENSR
jgi:hypothetical protein